MARRGHGPTVVLVGRPNVGKSTLFNRIAGTRRSIVAPVAGTTRDFLDAEVSWLNRSFRLLDTGGLFGASEDPLHKMVVEQGLTALAEADLIVFVVDAKDGLVPGDEAVATALRSRNLPVLLAINKTDDKRAQARAMEFHRLGFDPVFEIAAEHGTGVAELLDEVIKRCPGVRLPPDSSDSTDSTEAAGTADPAAARETSIVIVGRPNVGKSSLVNRLLREERSIVSEMPGTTRDAVASELTWHKRKFKIVDTAGMRRPGRANTNAVEAVSVLQARRAMELADVAVVVLDAVEGATDRDSAIAGEAEKLGCGVILAVNKWDLVRGRGQEFVEAFDDKLRFNIKFLEYAPLLHLSALTGERTPKLLEAVDRVAAARMHRVPTAELNKFLEATTEAHPPQSATRREVRIMYGMQSAVAPPTFVLFTNVATELHFSYQRFLVNRLREAFGFEGSPIRLSVRRRARK